MRKFCLIVICSYSMLWCDWITVMFMINAMIDSYSSAEGKSIREMRSTFSSPLMSDGQHDSNNSIRHSRVRNNRKSKYGLKCKEKLDLELVIVKLKNVIDRYNYKSREMKSLYAPIEPDEPPEYGKSRNSSSAYMLPKSSKCQKIKNCKKLRKTILKRLSKFHVRVQYFEEKFQNITITHQSQGRKINGSRLGLLKKFKTDLQMLNVEINSVVMKQRLKNFNRIKIKPTIEYSNSNVSKIHQSDLLISECRIIQNSKKFLTNWMKKLTNVFLCS